jgi:hypothetical protein
MVDIPIQGILDNKMVLAVVLIGCLIETGFSAKSLSSSVTTSHDLVHFAGLLFAIAIFVSLTIRVRVLQERFVFGSGSAALCLVALLSSATPSIEITHLARWVILLAWISATLNGIALLWRRERSSPK